MAAPEYCVPMPSGVIWYGHPCETEENVWVRNGQSCARGKQIQPRGQFTVSLVAGARGILEYRDNPKTWRTVNTQSVCAPNGGRGDEGLTVVALMYGGIPASTNGYAHEFALPVGTIGEGCDAIDWVCAPQVPGAVQYEITLLGVVQPACERFAPGLPP
jgi:hypothetical protein